MDKFLEFLAGFNIQTIISLVAVMILFLNNIKSEIKLLEAKIDRQGERTDKLYEMFIDLLKSRNNNG